MFSLTLVLILVFSSSSSAVAYNIDILNDTSARGDDYELEKLPGASPAGLEMYIEVFAYAEHPENFDWGHFVAFPILRTTNHADSILSHWEGSVKDKFHESICAEGMSKIMKIASRLFFSDFFTDALFCNKMLAAV